MESVISSDTLTNLNIINIIITPNLPPNDITLYSRAEGTEPSSTSSGSNYLAAPMLYAAQDANDPNQLNVSGVIFVDAALDITGSNMNLTAQLNSITNKVHIYANYHLETNISGATQYIPQCLNRYYFSFSISNINLNQINTVEACLHKDDPITSRGTLTTVQKTKIDEDVSSI